MHKRATIQYRPEIDGLRALAVIFVILYHLNDYYPTIDLLTGGYLGVDIFFIISGYLITKIILTKKSKNTFDIKDFYCKRIKRILPAMLVMLLVVLSFTHIFLPPLQGINISQTAIASMLLSVNHYFIYGSSYFKDSLTEQPLLHMWSLSIEEQFYLLFPFLLILTYRPNLKCIAWTIGLLAVTSVIAAEVMSHINIIENFYLMPYRFWELLIGSGVGILDFYGQPKTTLSNKQKNYITVTCTVILLCCAYFFTEDIRHPSLMSLIPTCATAALIRYTSKGGIIYNILSHKISTSIGKISYSLYLWHVPILAAFTHLWPQMTLALGIIYILINIVVAYLSYRHIERPCITAENPNIISKIGVLYLCIIAYAVIIQQNSYSQLSNETKRWVKQEAYSPYYRIKKVDLVFRKKRKISKPFRANHYNILIMGDSQAGDLINAISTQERRAKVEMTSMTIPTKCDKKHHIITTQPKRCGYGQPTSKDLALRLKKTDMLILSKSWKEEDLEPLQKALRTLEKMDLDRIIVVGKKSFGHSYYDYAAKRYISIPFGDTKKINAQLKTLAASVEYLDLQTLICIERDYCVVSTASGHVKNIDSNHLSPDGAIYLGKKLKRSPVLNNIFRK